MACSSTGLKRRSDQECRLTETSPGQGNPEGFQCQLEVTGSSADIRISPLENDHEPPTVNNLISCSFCGSSPSGCLMSLVWTALTQSNGSCRRYHVSGIRSVCLLAHQSPSTTLRCAVSSISILSRHSHRLAKFAIGRVSRRSAATLAMRSGDHRWGSCLSMAIE